ncbi:hypothetical protein G4313_00740 [Coprococcus eutactus]|jgi:hypothetical protein|nr:hypothetical protein [Coprococcus eutactus]
MNWWFIIGVTVAGILCLIKVIVDRQGKKLPGTITDFVNENGVDFPVVQFQYNGQDMKLLAANGGNKKLNRNDPVEIIYRLGKAKYVNIVGDNKDVVIAVGITVCGIGLIICKILR